MKKWPGITAAGTMAIGVYLTFAVVSYLLYPTAYNPADNWLSDLGNPLNNPCGSIFYRLGCAFAAIALIVFYFELRRLNNGSKRMTVLLLIAQITGVLSSIALIVTGIFPLGTDTSIHSVASIILYIGLAFFELFSAIVFIRYTKYSKWIAYFGFAAYAVNVSTGVFFNKICFAEWVVVAMFMAYEGMIVSYYKEIAQTEYVQLD